MLLKQKVWTYKKNGNYIYQCNMELEKVREHIFYYTEPTEYGYNLYYIVVENKGEFFHQGLAPKNTIDNATWEQMLEEINNRITDNGYFNQLAIKLLTTISDELCQKAIEESKNATLKGIGNSSIELAKNKLTLFVNLAEFLVIFLLIERNT